MKISNGLKLAKGSLIFGIAAAGYLDYMAITRDLVQPPQEYTEITQQVSQLEEELENCTDNCVEIRGQYNSLKEEQISLKSTSAYGNFQNQKIYLGMSLTLVNLGALIGLRTLYLMHKGYRRRESRIVEKTETSIK